MRYGSPGLSREARLLYKQPGFTARVCVYAIAMHLLYFIPKYYLMGSLRVSYLMYSITLKIDPFCSGICFFVFFPSVPFSFCRFFALFLFLCSRWSFVDVPLICSCPADHVPNCHSRILQYWVWSKPDRLMVNEPFYHRYDVCDSSVTGAGAEETISALCMLYRPYQSVRLR